MQRRRQRNLIAMKPGLDEAAVGPMGTEKFDRLQRRGVSHSQVLHGWTLIMLIHLNDISAPGHVGAMQLTTMRLHALVQGAWPSTYKQLLPVTSQIDYQIT